MWLNDELPEDMRAAALSVGVTVDDEDIHLASDLNEHGDFSTRWLIMTKEHILVLTPEGQVERHLRVADVEKLEAQNHVGGGLLRAHVDSHVVPLVRYSAARALPFGTLARGFQQWKRGRSIDTDSGRRPNICPECGRRLSPHESVCSKCIKKWEVVRRIWHYGREFKGRLAIIAAVVLTGTVSTVLPFGLWKFLIDDVFNAAAPKASWLLWMVLTMVFLGVMQNAMRAVQQIQTVYVGQNLVYRIRADLFNHVMRMGLPFFDKFRAGELMSRVDHDTSRLERLLIEVFQLLFRNVVLVVGIMITLLIINWQLALIALLPLPFVVLVSVGLVRWVVPVFHRLRQRQARMSTSLNTAFTGVRLVKAFGREDWEIDRFDTRSQQFRDTNVQLGRTFALAFPIMGVSMQVGVWLIWYVGGRNVLSGIMDAAPVAMSLGDLMAFVGLVGMFYNPFTELLRVSRWATDSLTSAQRIFDILDVEPDRPAEEASVPLPEMKGHVRFDNITFGYEPLKPVLRDFSLDVAPGEMIGLVGHSGAGKTTTTNLLMNFYNVDEGEISVDGVGVDKIGRDDLRRQVAAVPQEPYLFAGSVTENISYGKQDATPEEIIAASMAANAHGFIMDMPDGYDSAVGEQGQRMSTGERQRLTIARAIICNPRILILDEATSSVDTDTEKQIQEALDRLVKDRTTFAIAHRLSTLRNADRLVVLKDGTIEEVGSHEELLEKDGEYKRLVEIQSELSKIATVGG